MQEIEIKLKIKARDKEKLAQHALLIPFQMSYEKKHLISIYYDTSDMALRYWDFSLRVRQVDNEFWQTVKSAGTAVNGVHTRHEWECQIAQAEPDFDLLPEEFKEKLLPLKDELQVIFVTDFMRETWQIKSEQQHIELALDEGEIRVNDKWVEPILEVELEIKNGEPAGLVELAKELRKTIDLKPFDASKAKRGYRLFKLAQFNKS